MKAIYTPFSQHIYYNGDLNLASRETIKQWIEKAYSDAPLDDRNANNIGFTSYFHTDNTCHLDTVGVFKELRDTIIKEAMVYIENVVQHQSFHGAPASVKPVKISKMWFNVNPPSGFQGRHHHADHLLGGTYYVNAPANSGSIEFHTPCQFAYYNDQKPTDKTLTIPMFNVDTTSGDLLLWHGSLSHEVSLNLTKTDSRITVSFCLDWDE
jgi:uncharacterized protein (TIGR02466 family)